MKDRSKAVLTREQLRTMTKKQIITHLNKYYPQYKKANIIYLAKQHLTKAKHNLNWARASLLLSTDKKSKERLKLEEKEEGYDWVITQSYYSMYHVTLGVLAKINIKCANHEAARYALYAHYVKTGLLKEEYMEIINRARELEWEYVEKLEEAKETRVKASYHTRATFSRGQAEKILEDGVMFINRLAEIIEE